MKIFHIVSNKEWGGGEQYVYDLSQHQREDGIDVTIFCKPVEAIIQKYAEAGMKVVPLALGGALDVKSAWQMARAGDIEQEPAEHGRLHSKDRRQKTAAPRRDRPSGAAEPTEKEKRI